MNEVNERAAFLLARENGLDAIAVMPEIPEFQFSESLPIQAQRCDPDEPPYPNHDGAPAREGLRPFCCKVMGLGQGIYINVRNLRPVPAVGSRFDRREPGNDVSAGGIATAGR